MIASNKFCVIFFMFLCVMKVDAQNDSQKVQHDIATFSKFLSKNSDSAIFFIRRAHAKSKVLKNDSLLARTNYNLGYYYYLKNNVDSAKVYLKKGLEYAKKSNFKKIQCLSYQQKGTIATDENQFDVALKAQKRV